MYSSDSGEKMNQVDKISKEALDLLQYAKDTAVANLTVANRAGKLNPQLEPAQLLAVVDLLGSSLSQGYQKGLTAFQKAVKEQLPQESTKAETSNKKK